MGNKYRVSFAQAGTRGQEPEYYATARGAHKAAREARNAVWEEYKGQGLTRKNEADPDRDKFRYLVLDQLGRPEFQATVTTLIEGEMP